MRTVLYELLEHRLGTSLADFVAERRGESIRPPASWRAIATELTQRTGVYVTHASLRLWFADESAPAGGAR